MLLIYSNHFREDAATLDFDGAQYFHVPFSSPSRTEAEDWRIRFRTSKPSGLLFTTGGEGNHYGRAELDLDGGRLRFMQFSIDRPKVESSDQLRILNGTIFHCVSFSLSDLVYWSRTQR